MQSNGTNGYQAQEVSLQPETKPYLAEEQGPILESNSFIDKEETNILESEPNQEHSKYKEQF